MDTPASTATPAATITITAEDLARMAKRRLNASALPAAVAALGDKASAIINANAETLVQHIREAYAEWAATKADDSKAEFKFGFSLALAIIPRGDEADITVELKHSVKYAASDAATVNANGDITSTQE